MEFPSSLELNASPGSITEVPDGYIFSDKTLAVPLLLCGLRRFIVVLERRYAAKLLTRLSKR